MRAIDRARTVGGGLSVDDHSKVNVRLSKLDDPHSNPSEIYNTSAFNPLGLKK